MQPSYGTSTPWSPATDGPPPCCSPSRTSARSRSTASGSPTPRGRRSARPVDARTPSDAARAAPQAGEQPAARDLVDVRCRKELVRPETGEREPRARLRALQLDELLDGSEAELLPRLVLEKSRQPTDLVDACPDELGVGAELIGIVLEHARGTLELREPPVEHPEHDLLRGCPPLLVRRALLEPRRQRPAPNGS